MSASSAPLVALNELALRTPRFTRRLTTVHGSLYLATQGRVLSRWFGAGVLVLETTGRRTGARRLAPLVYVCDGDDFAVVPANGGAARAPGWWLNLRAHGRGVALLKGERLPVVAAEATGERGQRLWRRLAAVSALAHYQRRTERRLPVAVLQPTPEGVS